MRYIHVCTSHGCGMPAVHKAAAAEIIQREQDAQLAKGRRRPVTTNVGRYVERRAPAVARALRKILRAFGERLAKKAALLYGARLAKDLGIGSRIQQILDELNFDGLGLDLEGELEGAMLAAFKRAAALGLTQVGIEDEEGITEQVDEAAVEYARARGGRLIKDLAGTTEDAMRSLLSRAVDEGMSVDDLSTEVQGLGAFSEWRADLIARTELAFAHVQGNVQGWRASGEVVGKRWILADTHPVPDECDDAADVGVVGLDDEFLPGVALPPAHPGCLCDVLPILGEPGDDNDDEGG
jgi:hypothetical protein